MKVVSEEYGIDLEAEIVVVTDDVPMAVTPEQAASDTRSNIRAAAALLAHYGARKNKGFPLADWESAVARYSGIPQREIAQIYTYEILTAIRQGRESADFKVSQRHVEMEKAYGKEKLKKLSARRIMA